MIENSILNDRDKSDSDELRKRRIVVRNLKEREAENVVERVNNVIQYLKVKSVKVISAERKENKMSSKPGIIIATLRTKKEKEQLMKVKKDLRNSSRYKDAYIDHDIPSYHRKIRNNLHTIVTTLGQEKLQIKGSYVYKSEQNRTAAGNERYNSNRDHDRHGTRRDNSNSHTLIEERSLNSDRDTTYRDGRYNSYDRNDQRRKYSKYSDQTYNGRRYDNRRNSTAGGSYH